MRTNNTLQRIIALIRDLTGLVDLMTVPWDVAETVPYNH
jgi:hypothetical protein